MVSKQNTKPFLHRGSFGPSLSEKAAEMNISSWIANFGENRSIQIIDKPQTTSGTMNDSNENVKQAFQSRAQLFSVKSKPKTIPGNVDPHDEFHKRLKKISGLAHDNVNIRDFYLSCSGFDTPVNQEIQHQWRYRYSIEISSVAQHASGGTDRETASNAFMNSGGLKTKYFLSGTPDVKKPDQGGLMHRADVRSIYATPLNKRLEVLKEKILNSSLDELNFI